MNENRHDRGGYRPLLMLLLSLAGLGVSAYLAFSHYRIFTDLTYQSFCAISQAFNCDTVSQSPYALLLNVPVAIWGMLGYAFLGGLLVLLLTDQRAAAEHFSGHAVRLILAAYCAFSLVLAYISAVLIKSYCVMCLVLYGINFSLLVLAWGYIRRPPNHTGSLKEDLRLLLFRPRGQCLLVFFGLLGGILPVFFPAYWTYPATAMEQTLVRGITEEGHPYLGASSPVLEIVEFTDYQCSHCKRLHYLLRRLIAAWPDQIRLVHRHFPMDHQFNPIIREPFYVGSGMMALAAIHAAAHNRFWEMNDLLYQADRGSGQINLGDLLNQAGVFDTSPGAITQPAHREYLWQDIRAGLELGISATPSYWIDGEVYTGHIPPTVLRRVAQIY